jgi:hypothetical protein
MRARLRKLVLFGALAGIVGFLLLDKPQQAPGVATVQPTTGDGPRKTPSENSLQLPERRGLAKARGELFGAPPAPPKAAPTVVVATTPVAPPVPYRFAGKVRKGAEEEVLLSKGDLVFAIKVGDTLDGMYRVESIGAERIELLYLPLGTTDRIVVSSTLDVDAAPTRATAAPVTVPVPVPVAAQAQPLPVADGKPAQLRWEGPERVQAGASFNVALRVNTKEALRAAPMQLRFEPGVLEPVNVRPGKFFGQGNFSYRVNPEGSIFVGATSSAPAPGSDVELLIVTFRPIKRGATAELSMSALSLQGAAGRAIAHEQPSAFRTAIH